MVMLIKKRTLRFFLHEKSAAHLVVIEQPLFAHVGLPNLFTFYWLSGIERWHSALQASDLNHKKQGIGEQMYRVSDRLRSAHDQDGAIVLDVRQGQMFKLNCVGSRILELLKSGSTGAEIVDEITRQFGVNRDLAENDVQEFFQNLKKCGLVEEDEPGVAV